MYLVQTCATISNYMKESYVSPGTNDIQMLQNAVRADLRNYALMRLLKKKNSGNDGWKWVLDASIIAEAQNAGLEKTLGWLKDIPYVQSQCRLNTAHFCDLYLESLIIDTYLNAKDPSDCKAVGRAIDDAVAYGLPATVTLTVCKTDAKTLDWLMTAGTDATNAVMLMKTAAAFDRLYGHMDTFGMSTSFGDEAYADQMVGILANFDLVTGGSATADAKYLKLMFYIYAAAAADNYREIVYRLTSSTEFDDILKDSQTENPERNRILLIAGDVANAKHTVDLSTTINSIAGPTGGYKYKAVTPNLLTLTGLVGLDYERDRLKGPTIDTTVPARGAFAPVGLEYSTPCGVASCGLLLSIVDVGGLVNYSNTQTTSKGNVASTPNSSFAQVESLGLYFARSFGSDSPFVWGFGTSYTPNLRSAMLTGGQTENLNAHRYMVFIGVDVTLAPLKEDWNW